MKKVKYIVMTIFLGALGNAFWELFLRKLLLNWTRPHFLKLFGDAIYSRVHNILNDLSYFSFTHLIVLFLILILAFPDNFEELIHSDREKKGIRIFQRIIRVFLFFFLVYQFVVVSFATTIAEETIYDIEIVSPYITDMEYKQLRSEFYQIDSEPDYDNLMSKISIIAKSNSLELR